MNIEVVLIQDDPKLGKRGDIVKVSSGFAQNFLFPHSKAKPATPSNLKSFQDEKNRMKNREEEKLAAARAAAEKLTASAVTLEVQAGESDKLYGAVTLQDILEALSAKGILLEKKDIHLAEPIRKLGTYEVTVRPHPSVSVALKLIVVKKK